MLTWCVHFSFNSLIILSKICKQQIFHGKNTHTNNTTTSSGDSSLVLILFLFVKNCFFTCIYWYRGMMAVVIIIVPPGLPYSCELRPAPRQGIALHPPQGAAVSLSGSR